jgi:iron complex transport system substrate-binding protein
MTRVVTLLLLALLAVGCGERAEPLGRDAAAYPVTVRGAGERPVELERQPETIVALDPGAADLLEALGADASLVEAEAAAELEPELIVTGESGDSARAALAARRSGAELYIQPDRSLRDVRRAILEVGFLVGEPVRARRLAADFRGDVAEVERAVGGRPPARVFVDTGFFIPPPESSLLADLVRRAGGESVAHAPEGEAFEGCDVLRLEPDVVLRLIGPDDPPARAGFRGCRDRLDSVRLVDLPADLGAEGGPRAAAALRRIAKALHPDAFR